MLQQLCDLVAFANGVRLGTKVLHEDDYLASVTGIDNAGVARQPFLRHARAGFDETSSGRYKLNGNTGANSGCSSCGQRDIFGRVNVLADVFSGMCYCGQQASGESSFTLSNA